MTPNVSVSYHQPRWRVSGKVLAAALLIWELAPEAAPSPAVTQPLAQDHQMSLKS